MLYIPDAMCYWLNMFLFSILQTRKGNSSAVLNKYSKKQVQSWTETLRKSDAFLNKA